jgi:hypothetical protein
VTEPAAWAGGAALTGEGHEEAGYDAPGAKIKRHFLRTRGGQQFTLYAGLIDLLHQVSGGRFRLNTEVLQFPGEGNGQLCVCRATVSVADDQGETVRMAQGIGDASPQNVDRQLAPHLVRTAETRAKARALRDLLNVALVWVGEPGPEAHQPEDDTIQVDGRPYTRPVIWDMYRRRVALARARGLPVTAEESGRSATDPLGVLVATTQALKRRMGRRAGAGPGGLP